MAEYEDEIVAAGAEIIWVLEQGPGFEDGTAELCMEILDDLGSEDQGWCVGDEETEPQAGTFDDSPFSVNRGFDMIVPTGTMVIEWNSSHGSPPGNDNTDGEQILAEVEAIVAAQR